MLRCVSSLRVETFGGNDIRCYTMRRMNSSVSHKEPHPCLLSPVCCSVTCQSWDWAFFCLEWFHFLLEPEAFMHQLGRLICHSPAPLWQIFKIHWLGQQIYFYAFLIKQLIQVHPLNSTAWNHHLVKSAKVTQSLCSLDRMKIKVCLLLSVWP